jgi:hypothetical protein
VAPETGMAWKINSNFEGTNGFTAYYFPTYGSNASMVSSGDGDYQKWKHYFYQFDGTKVEIYVNARKRVKKLYHKLRIQAILSISR